MNIIFKSFAFLIVIFIAAENSLAQTYEQNNLTISRIRAVGDYSGTTFDNTVELWLTTSLVFPAGSPCTNTARIYIDKKHEQIISAAYMAFAAGKKVNLNVDPNLPNRAGSCEISFLEVMN